MFQNNPFIQKSILATLSYFDIFSYPLTLVELYKYFLNLDCRCLKDNQEIQINLFILDEHLNQLIYNGKVASADGFYCLSGRSQIIKIRLTRYKLAQGKYKKALTIGKILSFIPGVRLIAVCNNLAYNNAEKYSDIDFFIITACQRIWFVRFFCNLVLTVLTKRPKIILSNLDNVKKTQLTAKNNRRCVFAINSLINQDKICTSFFIAEDNLNLESYKIYKDRISSIELNYLKKHFQILKSQQDWYLIFWISQIRPIYDQNNVYKKFIQANLWIKRFLPCLITANLGSQFLIQRGNFKNFLEKLVNNLDEKFYKFVQIKLMPGYFKKNAQQTNSRVIIADNILKFHYNDRRAFYNTMFEKEVKKFLS